MVVHLVQRDRERGIDPQRKLFVSGASLGGYTAAAYCMRYHGPNSPPPALTEPDGPIVSGVILQCPLIEVSADSRPAYAVELVARGLAFFLGRLGFAAANKGRNTDHIEIEYGARSDPLTSLTCQRSSLIPALVRCACRLTLNAQTTASSG